MQHAKIQTCERIISLTRLIRRTASAEEAQEAAEIEQLIEQRLDKFKNSFTPTPLQQPRKLKTAA